MDTLLTHLAMLVIGLSVGKLSVGTVAGGFNHLLNRLKHIRLKLQVWGSFSSKKDLLEEVDVQLLDRFLVEQQYTESNWQFQGYSAFAAQLVSKERIFPCIYGTKGYKANELDFLFLPSEDLTNISVACIAAKGILKYHANMHTRGRNTSLVMMCPPPTVDRTVAEYHHLFWSFLCTLRTLDPKPWPDDIPRDTEAERWCFNFEGISTFIAVLTPAHRQRKSRFAPNFCMVYQPRSIFERIFTTERIRLSATKTVRELVDNYDEIPHSPDISNYAATGSTESRQYFLLDENQRADCPYSSLDEIAL